MHIYVNKNAFAYHVNSNAICLEKQKFCSFCWVTCRRNCFQIRPDEPTAPETEVCVTMLPSAERERWGIKSCCLDNSFAKVPSNFVDFCGAHFSFPAIKHFRKRIEVVALPKWCIASIWNWLRAKLFSNPRPRGSSLQFCWKKLCWNAAGWWRIWFGILSSDLSPLQPLRWGTSELFHLKNWEVLIRWGDTSDRQGLDPWEFWRCELSIWYYPPCIFKRKNMKKGKAYETLTFCSLRAMGSKKDLLGFPWFTTSTQNISGSDENLPRFPISRWAPSCFWRCPMVGPQNFVARHLPL